MLVNRNKEYRLKRKNQRKDYIIQDKNVKIKSLYYQNETKKEKMDTLKEQNRILKEKVNKFEETWREFKSYIDNNMAVLQNPALFDYYLKMGELEKDKEWKE